MSEFSRAYEHYYKKDFSVFPLPVRKKNPPPPGYTGSGGKRADISQLRQWDDAGSYRSNGENHTIGNIGLWLGHRFMLDGVEYENIGIDVDQYNDKFGWDQLQVLEEELGKLPSTWISSARDDGVSGIRYFRVPAGMKFKGKADKDVDVIYRGYRFAVVWPSVHPDGMQYWWYPPGVMPTTDGQIHWREGDLPDITKFPQLPESWIEFLTANRKYADYDLSDADYETSVSELATWAEDTFPDGSTDKMCLDVALLKRTYLRRITEEESSHDKITDAHWHILRKAAEGHTGWSDAIAEIEQHWKDKVLSAGKRSLSEANREIFRSVTGALRKIKKQVDADPVPDFCPCAGASVVVNGIRMKLSNSRSLWYSEREPLKVAEQVVELNEREETPLRYWRNGWCQYHRRNWKSIGITYLEKMLYDYLKDADCIKMYRTNGHETFKAVPWAPEKRKIATVEHAMRSIALLPDDIEPPCWLDNRTDKVIALRNTLLRIEDRAQIPHTPTYFNFNALPFDYDPNAESPTRWLEFLSELWPDDPDSIALLQEWFGYVLSGQTSFHKMMMLIGPRRSGKTTIAHVLRTLVGEENETECRSSDIVDPFGLANLIGRTLGIFDDDRITGNGKKFVDMMKNIIGEGKVSIRRKHKDDWNGRLNTRFMYIANELSAFPDSSGAIVQRMLVLETYNNFEDKPDRTLRATLEAEMTGIFNWALDGLDRLNAQQHFTVPASSRQVVEDLYNDASPETQFIEETCVWDKDGVVSKLALYERYRMWCHEKGKTPKADNAFFRALRSAYGRKLANRKIGRKPSLAGLRLAYPGNNPDRTGMENRP